MTLSRHRHHLTSNTCSDWLLHLGRFLVYTLHHEIRSQGQALVLLLTSTTCYRHTRKTTTSYPFSLLNRDFLFFYRPCTQLPDIRLNTHSLFLVWCIFCISLISCGSYTIIYRSIYPSAFLIVYLPHWRKYKVLSLMYKSRLIILMPVTEQYAWPLPVASTLSRVFDYQAVRLTLCPGVHFINLCYH